LDSSLPDYLPSITANNKLEKDFEMVATEVVLIDNSLDDSKVNEMLDKIENLDGVEWAAGLSRISETSIPKDAIPTDILEKIQNDKYQLLIINSTYGIATDELNDQIDKINDIIKSYDEDAILAGVGPLMKDLVVISDHDFKSVNTISIAVIFIIMVFVLKSISLPIILIATIEFAIFINMGIPYYTNTVIPFIASIVIGTIQLGATIDYAILITTKYISKRKEGNDKGEAIDYALGTSISSIFVSGLCFFGATFGVGIVSKLEMIASLCAIMARGAIVSMLVVVIVLPSFLMLFDKIICKTTKGLSKVNN
jgi:predicted RND superfamily exporter protein